MVFFPNLHLIALHKNNVKFTITKSDAPQTGQPASSLGGPPSTNTTPVGSILSGTLLFVGIASGTSLVLINILIIGCCLRKRTTKRIKRGK